MSKIPLLLVEYNTRDLDVLTRDLRNAGYEVRSASTPDAVTRESVGDVQLLITHLHFHNARGNRDEPRAAVLCKQVREWTRSDLPIIGLSSRSLDDEFPEFLKKHGFPPDLYALDLDFSSTDRLVRKVKEVLDESSALAS